MSIVALVEKICQDLPKELRVYSEALSGIVERRVSAHISEQGYVSQDEMVAIQNRLKALSLRIEALEGASVHESGEAKE